MVEPHSSNFRVITTNFLGVRIFRKFKVVGDESTVFFGCPKTQDHYGTVKIQKIKTAEKKL